MLLDLDLRLTGEPSADTRESAAPAVRNGGAVAARRMSGRAFQAWFRLPAHLQANERGCWKATTRVPAPGQGH
jgi:hypothetical protein